MYLLLLYWVIESVDLEQEHRATTRMMQKKLEPSKHRGTEKESTLLLPSSYLLAKSHHTFEVQIQDHVNEEKT